jgi:DNA-binding transcriptional ArsR family regulator
MLSEDAVSRTFAALADPTRRSILERLAAGELGVVELARGAAMTQPAITKHLRVLERAGLVSRSREGQRRPARLRPDGLVPADLWMRRAREEWMARLDRLESHLATWNGPTEVEEAPDA